MIRFVDMRQANAGVRFAFWDTCIDRFVEIGNELAWVDLEDFETTSALYHVDPQLVARLSRLCPDWVRECSEE